MKIYIDGKFIDSDSATISLHDAGLQHSVGIFETMQAFNANVFRLDAHIDRLITSAKQLGLTNDLHPAPLAKLVQQTLTENNLAEARIRLTVTGGDMSLLRAATTADTDKPAPHRPTIICVPSHPTIYPPAFFDQGVTVVIADAKTNPFDPTASHKTLNYWSRLRALADAATLHAGEALWFSVSNHLAGGSVSNAFIVKDNQLLTPIARGEEPKDAIPSPVLPGITRAAILELADQLDIPIQKRLLNISDLLEADELFLTNSSWLILPVIRVESHPIADSSPGPITTKLRTALLNLIKYETTP